MKKIGVLVATAIFCATYLSTTLTILGIDKYYYILAGGRKFATFPSLGSQVQIGLSYLILALLYLVWFFGTQRLYTFSSFSRILKITAVFLGLAFISYPLGNDIYLYLHAGLMDLSNVNPFVVRAGSFTSALSSFVDWGQTSTYGPVSQLLFTLSAACLAIHPFLAIYSFKAVCLGLHILNGYLLWRYILSGKITPALQVPERGKITLAYLINPLLLMEQVGSAHVDVLVSSSLVLFAACLLRHRYVSGFIVLWAGLLSKTLPLIWMPIVGLFLLRQRRRSWQLIGIIALSLELIVALWLTTLPTLQAWASLLNPGVAGQYQSSIHTLVKFGLDLVRIFYPGSLTLLEQNHLLLKFSQYMLIGFAGFYGWTLWKGASRRNPSQIHLLEDLGWVTMVLLLFATPWLMPWYASILITLAALIPRSHLFGLTSLMFGLSSSAQYLLQGHSSLKGLISVGIPVLAFAIGIRLFSSQSSVDTQRPGYSSQAS